MREEYRAGDTSAERIGSGTRKKSRFKLPPVAMNTVKYETSTTVPLSIGRTVGCIVLVLGVGRCAFRPPRVVFVLGLVSLMNSLTSGKIQLPHRTEREEDRREGEWTRSRGFEVQ